MNEDIEAAIQEYKTRRDAGTLDAGDRVRLEAVRQSLRDRLKEAADLDLTTVHQAEELYHFLADWQGSVDLLTCYLAQSLSVDEKAWTWWHVIDNLCLLERCDKAVDSIIEYIAWTREQWERREISSSKLLLTIADDTWDRGWELHVQALDMEARIHLKLQNMEEVRRAGIQAGQLLDSLCSSLDFDLFRTRLAIPYDNIAATMFVADQYDLSIPLHQKSLELSPVSEFAYLALPAALWVTNRERKPVLALLREGATRCRGDWFAADFRNLPEIADVRDDAEFVAAVSRVGPS